MSTIAAAFLGRIAPALIVAAGAAWVYPPAGLIVFGGMVWLETRFGRAKG